MNVSEAITRIADDSNVQSGVSNVSGRILRELNRVCSELWDGFAWSFRHKNYRIVTDVDVTSGTVTATNGSRTITASGTPFLSTHANWHIYFPGDSILNWYKVRAYTSTSQIELDVPYQGTSGSSKTYILRHFDYVLPTEPWDLSSIIVTYNNKVVPILQPTSMDILGPNPINNGFPVAVSIYSSNYASTAYSTGTVSGTVNTQTLTGSGTSWLSNVYPGDSVTIGSFTYVVQSVDSNTSITLYNNQQTTTSSTTYSITRQFNRILRVLWPSNNSYVLDIRGLRKYVPLVNNYDTNEILYRYPNTVITKVSALELKSQGDRRAPQLFQEAELMVSRARAEDQSLTIQENAYPIFTYRGTQCQ